MRFVFLAFLLLMPLPAPADGTEELVREVESFQEELQRTLQKLQNLSVSGEGLAGIREKVLRLASDDRFLKAAQDLWSHPNRNTLLAAEVAFVFMMFLLKAWRQAVSRSWLRRIFVGLFLGMITWAGMLVVLPYVILGEPFRIFVLTLWRVFVS
jgi:hypothetical protein